MGCGRPPLSFFGRTIAVLAIGSIMKPHPPI